MKIAILTPTIDAVASGGVERFSQYLLRAFANADVTLIGRENLGDKEEQWVRLSQFLGLQQPALGYFIGVRAQQEKCDLYITNGLLGWNIRNSNCINIQHSTFAKAAIRVDKGRHFLKYVIKRYVWGYFEKLAAQHAKIVVAVSGETKESVQSLYHVQNVIVIPNAVDTDFFHSQDKLQVRQKAGLSLNAPIGLFVGRFEYAKGKPILDSLQSFFEQRGGKLIIAEHYSQKELVELYAAADVFLLPSLHEGCSYALLEAMSCGTPFVMSAVGLAADLRTVFPDYVIAEHTTIAYERAIEKVLSLTPDERQLLTTQIRDYAVQHYSIRAFNKAYQALV